MSPSTLSPTEISLLAVTADRHGKYISLAMTLLVHFLLAAFLLYGIRWQTKVNEAVEVELVGPVSVASPVGAPPPPPPPAEPAKVTPRPVRAPVAEPGPSLPQPRPDIALKEKKPEPRPQPQPRPHAVAPEDPFQQQLEQELRRTSADRRAAEASSAAARELADFQSARASQAKDRAMADYIGRIRARIRGNIILPPDIKGNPEAVFEVVQFPSGEILSVHLKKTSGHAIYDAAVERAIHKSSPLPKPASGELFSRTLELRFHPLDE